MTPSCRLTTPYRFAMNDGGSIRTSLMRTETSPVDSGLAPSLLLAPPPLSPLALSPIPGNAPSCGSLLSSSTVSWEVGVASNSKRRLRTVEPQTLTACRQKSHQETKKMALEKFSHFWWFVYSATDSPSLCLGSARP